MPVLRFSLTSAQHVLVVVEDDLTVRHVEAVAFDEQPALRSLVQAPASVRGRSRLGSLELLNVNVFPVDPLLGLKDAGDCPPRVEEDVTVQLAEGKGFACSFSTRLNALTFWWVASGADDSEDITVSAGDCVFATQTSVMRSFRSSTSEDYGSAVIHAAGVPLDALPELAEKDCVVVRVESRSVDAVVTVHPGVRRTSVDLRRFSRPERETQMALKCLPWEALTTFTPGMHMCVNNHPLDDPPDPDFPDAPEPDEEPTPEDRILVRDFAPVAVARSGNTSDLLTPGGPEVVATTSPTINCLSLYWLSKRDELQGPSDIEVDVDGESLPFRLRHHDVFRSMSSLELVDVKINVIQVPLEALAAATNNLELVCGLELRHA